MAKTTRVSECKVPADLRKVLALNPTAKMQWSSLTPIARRDFISWIASAKQEETRQRRVASIPSRLASGKRRPCCYAVVPLDLYQALAGTPTAKSLWKELSPDEKRDFVSWVNSAKNAEIRRERVEKTCLLLATGKRRPGSAAG